MSKATAGLRSGIFLTACAKIGKLLFPEHRFQREMLLVVTIGATAYYLTALSSFAPLDPSWFSVALPNVPPQNLAGSFGANLAALAIYSLGAVAWLMAVPFLTSALLIARGKPAALAYSRLIGWLLAIAGACSTLALRWPEFHWQGFALPGGGLVGTTITYYLVRWFGKVGGWITMITVSACSLLLLCRRAILGPVYKRLSTKWHGWFERLKKSSEPQAETPSVARHQAFEPTVAPDTVSIFDWPAAPTEKATPKQPTPVATLHQLAFAGTDSNSIGGYARPPLSVFQKSDTSAGSNVSISDLEATAALLVKTFEDFGVLGNIIGYQPGPVVTVFEFQPEAGVKQAKVVGLIDDLALALKVDSIFIHPVRGKSALGVQVPNTKREAVYLGDILANSAFIDSASPLTFGMGKSINGQPMCADLSTMPHLLMAGATGSGKSVGINAMLCSIIMKASPEDVRMILVDPKMLELSIYEGIPHLLMPVITEPIKASLALQWAAAEMERRYKIMQQASVRNIAGFNDLWQRASQTRRDELIAATGEENLSKLPFILLVIDELADLMMTAPKDVESSIQRLAQKARASGIHMVLATQRPSVDIITGVIKANLPCRIAFQVVSKHDSRTILDLIGAEKLLGKGDMLLQRPGIGRLERLQGALITDEEVLNLVAAIKATSPVHYDESIIAWIDDELARQKDHDKSSFDSDAAAGDDPKWDEAIAIARNQGSISASFLQRQLKIGYNRAARIVEHMESRGYVDKADGAKPRRWLGPVHNV
ncbi:MAG: DNA translocase FtsK 4TM domain-containing protein [Proteobacteria bacterium]|nr:DNA translocase FtsK 4TM domain-containing protein [Pseudomonadota bacterium]